MELIIIISLLASIFGIIMSLSWFVQAHKVWVRKSSKDLSIIHIITFMVGTLVWCIYGLYTNDVPITASFGIGLIGLIVLLILALKYR